MSREIDSFIVELESRPDWRDTLFVITSDHGEGLFDHPDVYNSNRHGRLLYESQLWVPWILYSTSGDLPEGRVVEQRVRLLDLMPTLLDYAGVAGPPEMAGVSLMPLLEDEPRSLTLPDFFVSETTFRGSDKAALLTKDWHYIENYDHHPGTNAIALHPASARQNGTRTDVAEQHADVVRSLRAKLDQWKRDHPTGTSVPLGLHRLGDDETRQLEQLGYLDPKSP